ncbi:pilus assembly protein [Piscinibacter sakaiensis]|uniref:pilus assembly protein n=1 Tax=Piscinibacter sakaiensis TaxID=1547922 RepID=UPI003AADD7B6
MLPAIRLRLAPTLLSLTALLAAGFFMARSHATIPLDMQPVAWVAPLDFSSYNLAPGTAVAFRGDHMRATWDGDLVAHAIDAAGNWSVKWRAREQLPAAGSRKIFTSTSSGVGVAFRWSGASAISAAQQATLGDATNGPLVLDYLRGDASNETSSSAPAGLFRQRFSRIGGVIHSRPYVDGNEVYVGANDGMLHAFDAATGVERFAYIPSMLFAGGKLQSLSTRYSSGLVYGVDAPLTIGKVGTSKLLFAGLGAGAKGVFALNITNPAPASESAAAAMARWEITAATSGYTNLGNVMAATQLVKLNNGETALLVPNGLNSTNGLSSLFVVRATDGVRLAEISAGTKLADGSFNGLGGIAAVDRDGNGTVDFVYAGDLKGTLWKFDLSGTSLPTSGTALYTPDPSVTRPITVAPSVSLHPNGGFLINFGTGRIYSDADLTSTATEYLYGIWDNGTVTTSSLVTQTLTTHSVGSPATTVRTASSNAVNYGTSTKGWRIALGIGERLVGGDTLTDSGRYTVTTTVPNSGAGQGAWLVEVTALTGAAPNAPFFDLNGDGAVRSDNSDRVVNGATTAVPVSKFLGPGVFSQPVLAQFNSSFDLPFFNYNPNIALPSYTTVITTTPSNSGVFGGHFDFDIFYNCLSTATITKGSCSGHKHTHEYDDKFNVVGVNMLNPSDPAFNLSNPLPATSTQSFKILIANTLWSPAATMVIGDTISGQAWKLPVSPEGFLSDTPGGPAKVFTRNISSLSKFIYVLPLTAFGAKDWGTGQVRAGLIPTTTGCIQSNANPSAAWMDGAFTIQVVDASAGASDVQANTSSLYEANDPPGGYRLKDNNSARSKLIVQYATFWHAGKCRTQAGWSMAPPIDSSSDGSGSSPPGTDDPKGEYASGVVGGPAGGGTTVKHNYVNNGTTIEVLVNTVVDGSGIRQVLSTTSGTVVSDVKSTFGNVAKADLQIGQRARLGRLGWKEIIR